VAMILLTIALVLRVKVGSKFAKLVKCEYCALEFVYFVEVATSSMPSVGEILRGENAAKHGSSVRAQQKLDWALRGKIKAVACPQCGRYQKYMVAHLRGGRILRAVLVPLALVFGVIVSGYVMVMVMRPRESAEAWAILVPFMLALIPIVLGGGVWITWAVLVDDNADAARRKGIRSGDVMLAADFERQQAAAQARQMDKRGRWNDSLSSYLSHVDERSE